MDVPWPWKEDLGSLVAISECKNSRCRDVIFVPFRDLSSIYCKGSRLKIVAFQIARSEEILAHANTVQNQCWHSHVIAGTVSYHLDDASQLAYESDHLGLRMRPFNWSNKWKCGSLRRSHRLALHIADSRTHNKEDQLHVLFDLDHSKWKQDLSRWLSSFVLRSFENRGRSTEALEHSGLRPSRSFKLNNFASELWLVVLRNSSQK